jgi:8-oxo-dGTP diphosphatase
MQRYVLGIVTTPDFKKVLLVRKVKPAWQEGRWNGIGGKIEPDETPRGAMDREWREETQCKVPAQWDLRIRLAHVTRDSMVYFFHGILDHESLACFKDEGRGEILEIFDVAHLPESVMDNLRWMIPMFLDYGVLAEPITMEYV